MPLFFTPNQANDLLPQIERILAQVTEIKKDAEKVGDNEAETIDAMERFQNEIQKLQDLGCVLKDLNIGLIDFPAVRLGVRVWLCWKSGEREIGFWHGLHEGYAARKQVKENDFYPDDAAIKALTEASSSTQ